MRRRPFPEIHTVRTLLQSLLPPPEAMAARYPSPEDRPDDLSPKQLLDLVNAMTQENLEIFAQVYLNISDTKLDELQHDSNGSTNYKMRILDVWKKSSFSHDAKLLADLLYKAIDEHGLADPHKVEEIFGVPIPKSSQRTSTLHLCDQRLSAQSSSAATVSCFSWSRAPRKKELKKLAKALRPHTTDTMKIEVAPWIKDYVAHMDELYCELTLEKVENKLVHKTTKQLRSYEDCFEGIKEAKTFRERLLSVFNIDQSCSSRKKVLIKAGPGMGKTTLVKRIAYDWGRGVFNEVALILFVFLKLVKPRDEIEIAIIGQSQNKVLKGMKLTPDRLREILETFGSRCLLILDGMDEHASSSDTESINHDVIDIIEDGKFLDCHIILTSRPHSTLKYEKYFHTIVRVDGFTRSEAEKFAMKILHDEHMTKCVMEFNPSGASDSPLYNCPILLSFLCLLVREDGVELLDKNLSKGEIYARMVYCLYKKFTNRTGKTIDNEEFINIVKAVGKLAYESLISGKPMFSKNQVVRECGEEIFDIGLLIGNEDHRSLGTHDADIFITFPHRSLQQFLGSFYYVLSLGENQNVVSSVDQTFIADSPLILEFCVWLLFNSTLKPFVLPNKETALSIMSPYVANMIDKENLKLQNEDFPGTNIIGAFHDDNKQLIEFFKNVLELCHEIKHLKIPPEIPHSWVIQALTQNPPAHIERLSLTSNREADQASIERMLSLLFSPILELALSNYFLSQNDIKFLGSSKGRQNGGPLSGVTHLKLISPRIEQNSSESLVKELFRYAWPCLEQIYLQACNLQPKDLTSLALAQCNKKMPNLKILCICGNELISGKLSDLLSTAWPSLEILVLDECDVERNDLFSLTTAKEEGKLPSLKRLNLYGNKQISGSLSTLFRIAWPGLEELDLSSCNLQFRDLESYHQAVSNGNLPDLCNFKFAGLQELKTDCSYPVNITSLAQIKAEGKLPDLKDLCLDENEQISGNLSDLFDTAWLGLEELVLRECYLEPEDLRPLARAKAEGKLRDLKVLNLHRNKQISGNLFTLLITAWPGLEDLHLSLCDLNPDDLRSLARAKTEGKLPNLKSLYLGDNKHISCNLSALLSHAWPQLRSLYLCKVELKPEDLAFLARAKTEGKLPDLKVLNLSGNKQISGNLSTLFSTEWPGLENLNLGFCELTSEDLRSLAGAKTKGKLPDLKVLDLNFNKQISSNFSALFSIGWPGLEDLNLWSCDLKPEDLTSLAEAKLPDLKVLDLSRNKQISGSLSALFSTAWPGLEKLGLYCHDLKPEDLRSLARAKAEGWLPNLRVLYLWDVTDTMLTLLTTDPDTGQTIYWGTTLKNRYGKQIEI